MEELGALDVGEEVITAELMAELHPVRMRKILIEALQKQRYAEEELCRRLRRILHAARSDWSADEGSGDGEGGGVTMAALVHFLVEHTKPKVFSAISPRSQVCVLVVSSCWHVFTHVRTCSHMFVSARAYAHLRTRGARSCG